MDWDWTTCKLDQHALDDHRRDRRSRSRASVGLAFHPGLRVVVFVRAGARPAPRRAARPHRHDDAPPSTPSRASCATSCGSSARSSGSTTSASISTSLAFLGGAIGVGIGFGLQNIFSNFISGIIILVEKTLKIGDFVELQSGVRGTVAEIGMRYTRVTTNDSVDVLVPNSEFINGRVTNWTFTDRTRRIGVPFGVAYGSDKNEVREAALAAAKTCQRADHRRAASGRRAAQEIRRQQPRLRAPRVGRPRAGHADRAASHSRILWALEDELTKRGIEIPFPQRDLHIRSGAPSVAHNPDAGEGRLRGVGKVSV